MEALQRCREFDKGHCKKGRSCRKIHMRNRVNKYPQPQNSTHEEPQIITTVISHRERKRKSTMRRTQRNYNKPCIYYQQGRCRYNRNCKYLHDERYQENEHRTEDVNVNETRTPHTEETDNQYVRCDHLINLQDETSQETPQEREYRTPGGTNANEARITSNIEQTGNQRKYSKPLKNRN